MINIKAIIEVDVPNWQIGKEVSIYFPDTMYIKATVKSKGNICYIPEDATNGQTFIHVFGVDAWKQMIKFSNINDQFREYWNAPYKGVHE